MTYKINGVSLNDPARGWKLLRGTIPVSAMEFVASSFDLPGRDGSTTFTPTRRPVSFTFKVRSSLETRGDLLALFGGYQVYIYPEDSDREHLLANGYTLSSTVDEYHEALGFAVDSFVVEIPEGCWRNANEETTDKVSAATPRATVQVFPGISAPVQDAMIRIQGPIENAQVQDSGGSFFAIDGTIPAGSYVRYESATGRAWLTTGDTWVGGTELTGEIDMGGPRGLFEITPSFEDPETRVGKLYLSQSSWAAGAGISVQGSNAYLI